MTAKTAAKTALKAVSKTQQTPPAPAMDAEVREIAEQVERCGGPLYVGIDLGGTFKELMDYSIEQFNSVAEHTALAGVALLAAKAKCSHGQFAAALGKSGISQRQAQRAMAIARWLAKLPGAARGSILAKGATPARLRELARLEPAELEALAAEGGTDPEGLMALPQRELAARVRRLKRETARLEGRVERLEAAAADKDGKAAWEQFTELKMRDFRAAVLRAEDCFEQIEALIASWASRHRPRSVHGHRVNKLNAGVRRDMAGLEKRAERMRAAVAAALGEGE